MSRADIERKFRSNVGERWSSKQTDTVLQTLWTLEKIDDLSSVLGQMAV